MRCISPLTLRRNGVLETVPCGKCNFCLQTLRGDWSFRVNQEWKQCQTASFLTLTYDDENLVLSDAGPTLVKSDYQDFMKRLRKKQTEYSPVGLRYFACGEYGTITERPHYHAIMFNMHVAVLSGLQTIWGKGHVGIGTVTPESIHYTTGYIINRKSGIEDGKSPPFHLCHGVQGSG